MFFDLMPGRPLDNTLPTNATEHRLMVHAIVHG